MSNAAPPQTADKARTQVHLTERQREILSVAIGIVADEGYSNLTLRSLARQSGMKLGALQYHFRTWEHMLHGLATHIADEYQHTFDELAPSSGYQGLQDVVLFNLEDRPGANLKADRLFPQLWAMARVEPIMATLLDDIYAKYLVELETRLSELGATNARAEALVLLSMLEGTTLFVGEGARWAEDAKDICPAVLGFLRSRYGEPRATSDLQKRRPATRREGETP